MKILLVLLLTIGYVQARVKIATGGTGGTYYPFGQQIAQVCGNTVRGLDVISTKGSLDNIQKLLKESRVKFAIVQYDVLLNIMNNEKYSNKMKRSVSKLRVIMPLYDEEIHVIVRKDLEVNSMDDFKQLRVSVGKTGSGTYVTSANIAKFTGIRWAKTYTLNIKESLKALHAKKIDAVFYVSGAPSKIFNITEDMKIYKIYKNNFELLDISENKKLGDVYSMSKILKKDYKWMDKNIQTKSVKAVLITYNYKPFQPSYQRVKELYQCLYENIGVFQSGKYHPKWKEVDPTNFHGINWKTHDAVKEFLKENIASKKNTLASKKGLKEEDELHNFFDNL